jgi:carboxyl-terminal processing protease
MNKRRSYRIVSIFVSTFILQKSKDMMRKALVIVLFTLQFLSIQGQTVINLNPKRQSQEEACKKFERSLDLINKYYVDSVKNSELVEQAIIGMLRQLDPHSNYYTAEQIQRANEDLEGSFVGIGVEFQIIDDTAVVISVVPDGPAAAAGLKQGDCILMIDDEEATGSHVTNGWVSTRVRGEKETSVILEVSRPFATSPLKINIQRNTIPTYSVEHYFMLDKRTGYIKVSRFMRTTVEEFEKALKELRKQGLEYLILDLRGNTGGYLTAAVQLADHFLGKNKLIVYTEGLNNARSEYNSTGKGDYRKGKLVVLIDENSASASEIVTGAIQDWDRGIVMGRRSFGKGLVQKPYSFADGSAVRLTIARYYTPVGRSIQRPYDKGREKYYAEINEKIRKGIYTDADHREIPDSLKFKTPGGKVVYGGGGIMPDILFPGDTTRRSALMDTLFKKNMITRFALHTIIHHSDSLKRLYPDLKTYQRNIHFVNHGVPALISYAARYGVECTAGERDADKEAIALQLQVTLARLLFGNKASVVVQSESDSLITKAVEVIEDASSDSKHKISEQLEE